MNQQDWDDAFFVEIAELLGLDQHTPDSVRPTVEHDRLDELRAQYPDKPTEAAAEEVADWATYGE